MKKLKNFLLVDDSNSSNFFNKEIIKRTECVEEVSIAQNGKEAIEYLQSGVTPEVIFLDIHMPVMNGWDFLIEYKKLEDPCKDSIIILMSGTRLNAEDEEKLKSLPEVKGFRKKMLSKSGVLDIVDVYFG